MTYRRAARVIQRRVRQRRAAARTIQRVWRHCITDPAHPACRRRLMHEFNGLVADAPPSESKRTATSPLQRLSKHLKS